MSQTKTCAANQQKQCTPQHSEKLQGPLPGIIRSGEPRKTRFHMLVMTPFTALGYPPVIKHGNIWQLESPQKMEWVLNWLTSSINDSLSIALFDGTRSYLTKTYNTVYSMANSPLIAKQQTLPARLCTPSYKWVIIPLTIVRYITNKNQPVKLDQHWHRTNQSRDLAHWGTTLWGPGEKPAMFLQHWVPLRSTNRIICELDPSTSPGAKSGRDLPGVTKKISPSFFFWNLKMTWFGGYSLPKLGWCNMTISKMVAWWSLCDNNCWLYHPIHLPFVEAPISSSMDFRT